MRSGMPLGVNEDGTVDFFPEKKGVQVEYNVSTQCEMKITGEELLTLLRKAGYDMPVEADVFMYLNKYGRKNTLRITWSMERRQDGSKNP